MNPLRRRPLSVVLLLAFATGPALAADPAFLREQASVGLANHAPGVVGALPAEWARYDSEGGRFSVLFPALPALSQQATAVGTATVVNSLARVLVAEPLSLFTVDYRDVPPAWAREGLMPYLDEAASADIFALAGLRMTARRKITVGAAPGFEVSLEDPRGMQGKARMLVAGARLYSLTVFWEQGAKGGEALAERFFSSFDLQGALQGGPPSPPRGGK
jgi:hypothetical protein